MTLTPLRVAISDGPRHLNPVLDGLCQAQMPVQHRLMVIGAEPTPMSLAEFEAVVVDDSQRFGAIIRGRKITVE